MSITILIQASSCSWSGGEDESVRLVHDRPAIAWTIDRLLEEVNPEEIIIAAPDYDKGGKLDQLQTGRTRVFYGDSANPLLRIISATT